jgi:transcriptional regulator with XRE-family HTH domain
VKATETTILVPAQTRAARALVGWTQDRLAEVARVSNSTVRDFEAGRRRPHRKHLAAIRAALEAAGVEFTLAGDAGAGAKLLPPPAAASRHGPVPPREDVGASPAMGIEPDPVPGQSHEALRKAALHSLLEEADILTERIRREAAAARVPGVHRRNLMEAFRLIAEATEDCREVTAELRTTLGQLGSTPEVPLHLGQADRASAETTQVGDRGWKLVDHACRFCGARVLLRGEIFRCSTCAAESIGRPDGVCGCGILHGGEPGRMKDIPPGLCFRCIRNSHRSAHDPSEIVILFEGEPTGT